MEYGQFLSLLFERYGFVFGEREARRVLTSEEIDKRAFQANSERLENPAAHAGHAPSALRCLCIRRKPAPEGGLMNVGELVGAIATAILREELSGDADEAAQGTSRFLLDFSADHTAAIAQAVLADSYLDPKIEIKLPASHVGCHGLPNEVLTDYPATYFRNATCPKDAFLLAGGEHSEEASFNEIARLSPAELLDRIDLWIRTVSDGLHLSEDHCRWWERALTGLRDLRVVSLHQFATYVLQTREAIQAEGHPVLFALGAALPALRLPRDSYYFNIVKERQRTWPSVWRTNFTAAQRRRGCLLLKQRPNQLFLTEDELIAAFNRVRDSIPDIHHEVIEEFIGASSGWNIQAARLAECEWEEIKPLFDGLQREKFNLGQATLDFYGERETQSTFG